MTTQQQISAFQDERDDARQDLRDAMVEVNAKVERAEDGLRPVRMVENHSAGAAMVAALKLASSLREGTVVTIFPDFGEKYLSTNLWIGWQEWRREHLQRLVRKWNVSANATT